MKKLLVTIPVIASLGFASCSRLPDVQGNITNTQQIVETAQGLARTFCGILPLASTIGSIVAAMAGAGPVEVIATQVAHAFCDAIPPEVKASLSARAVRGAGIQSGVQTFGTINIGGRLIPLQGYVAP